MFLRNSTCFTDCDVRHPNAPPGKLRFHAGNAGGTTYIYLLVMFNMHASAVDIRGIPFDIRGIQLDIRVVQLCTSRPHIFAFSVETPDRTFVPASSITRDPNRIQYHVYVPPSTSRIQHPALSAIPSLSVTIFTQVK